MTCPLALVLGRVRIVLKDTTHPGNIGASARAMKTMGLTRLVLASPRTLLDSRSRAMAAGAADILAEMEVHDGLDGALTGAACVFGFTARRRSDGDAPLSACAAGAEAARRIRRGAEAVFLFGGERSGLSNEDVSRCRYTVEIPANPDYSSLNLAQAVQVAGYELRRALLAESDETEGGGGGGGWSGGWADSDSGGRGAFGGLDASCADGFAEDRVAEASGWSAGFAALAPFHFARRAGRVGGEHAARHPPRRGNRGGRKAPRRPLRRKLIRNFFAGNLQIPLVAKANRRGRISRFFR